MSGPWMRSDEDDTTWKVEQMAGHKVKKHRGSPQSMMAKVDWFTGPNSCVDFSSPQIP